MGHGDATAREHGVTVAQLPGHLRVSIPDPEIRAVAVTGTTVETIDARLALLEGRTDAAADQEREYLRGARARIEAKRAAGFAYRVQ